MYLELIREPNPRCTPGTLVLGDERLAYTMEDKYRPNGRKLDGDTCIPCGTYEVVITWSPRFGLDMPLLLNVPGFAGVRIHWGNTTKDTAGCILVGLERAGDSIRLSRAAYDVVFHRIRAARARGEIVHLEVKLAKEEQHAEGD